MIRVILLLILANVSLAQTVVTGTISYAPSARIRFISGSDYISGKKEPLQSVVADSAGRFSATLDIDRITFIDIVSEYYRAGFYASPGVSYKLNFLPPDSGEVVTLGREIPVSVDIIHPANDSINAGIREVNAVIDSFFNRNYELFVRKAAKQTVDKFKPLVHGRFRLYHPLVKNYLKYAFAPIDEAVFRDRKAMYREYFGGPVLYDNKDYMEYFNQYFIRYLQVQMLGKCESQYNSALNVSRSIESIADVMKKCDTIITNDTLRKLVILKGLKELYDQPKQNRENIRVILEKAAVNGNTIFSEFASNLLQELTSLSEGTAATFKGFTLLESGDTLNPEKYKGKYIYLFFWASWCDPCLQELKTLNSIKEKYQRKVVFVGVNIDKDPSDAKQTIKRYKFDWINIHDKNGVIAYRYKVKAVPRYFLIDGDGDFLQPPPSPGENLKGYLDNITRRK